MSFTKFKYFIEDLLALYKLHRVLIKEERKAKSKLPQRKAKIIFIILSSFIRFIAFIMGADFFITYLRPFQIMTSQSIIENLILLILTTLIIASVTLLERKILSLSQRRVGPNFVGYKGRLQYLADALKLFLKNTLIPVEVNKFLFIMCPSLIFSLCYTLWISSAWGLNVTIVEIEFNIVYISLLSCILSISIVLTGFISRNKYAFLASIRSLLMVLNLEIILGLFLLSLTFLTKSLSIFFFAYIQETIMALFNYIFIIGVIIVIFFLETSRAPFDVHEAESELVSGYNTEYGGIFFALYYLGEYFHLFFFASFLSVTLLGFDNSLFSFYPFF